MTTIIIKNQAGNTQVKTLTKDIVLNPLKGEQFFIDNSQGLKYKINIIENQKSVEILIETNPQIKIIFKNFIDIISDLKDNESAFCLLNTKEGLEEFNKTILNPNFSASDIIDNLKELLSTSNLRTDVKDGLVVDDFNSLMLAIESTASGNEIISNASTFTAIELENDNASNNLDSILRTRLEEIIQNNNQKNILDKNRKKEVEDDNLNVTLSGDSSVVEGEEATYKVSLKDDKGNSVEAIEDMVVSFKYTYTTASGEDITEVKTVTVLKGQSEASFKVSAVDDTYKDAGEKYSVAIDSATGISQYEKVTL
ncbi:hypothetical protein OZZ08_01565, partial [Malaciobacter mytili]|uniref:hypothetical protein n=1 Tax=Malaciobacter mytili TaxID=603050 RepID=UPI003BB026B1